MSMPKSEERALVAIAEQCAETRRPIKTMIVMAALNVKSGAPADALLVDLCSLKRQGLITQHDDAWEATVEGHKAARQIMAGQAPAAPKVEPIPEPSKPRDTLRPRALRGAGVGEALGIIEYPASLERLGPPISTELLNRCAAMNMALMAEARRRYEDEGCPEALSEIRWLAETGRLLLKAGGEE